MASRASQYTPLRWSHNRGRNGWDVPTDVAESMSAESMNVDLERGTLGKKRRGSATQAFSGDSFTGYNAVFRFVPGQDDTAAETHIVSTDATAKILRVAGGTAASNLTLKDNIATSPHLTRTAVLNGKLYFAYDSSVNRLHVYDPSLSTTTVRRAGLATPGAPTVADQGSGTYPQTARYYRIAWQVKSGSTLKYQSLLGTATAVFTPSGTGASARVTQPSVPSEGETHWIVYGSVDGDVYYEVSASIAIATTTYDDTADPDDYDTGTAAPDEGASTPFPSVKYLLSTGERLFGFGVWETSAGDSLLPRAGRLYFSPVLDSTDADDDERISNTTDFQGWIDVSRNSGGEDRALAGPLDAMVFAFQSRGIWAFVPTGDLSQPYERIPMSPELGAVSQESTFSGEDEVGRPCIYFLDPARGPYRYGARGMQWLGYDVQDIWATVNLAATTRVAAGVYDPEQRACIFWLATGAANVLSESLKFFVREGVSSGAEVRGGWVRQAEASASTFRTIALLPETFGAAMSRTLKPYLGNSTVLNRWNDESVQQDAGVSHRSYVTSKAYDLGAMHQRKRLETAYLQAGASSGVTITQSFTRNFGDETARTSSVLLTAAGTETRVIKRFQDAALNDANIIQTTLGDSAAANVSWTLDEWIGLVEPMEKS